MNELIRLLQGGKVLILGLGLEGQSTLRFLRQHYPRASVAVADQKEFKLLDQDTQELLSQSELIKIELGQNYLERLSEYDLIIKSPGISPRLPQIATAKQSGVVISSATNLFFQFVQGKTIGVTGTKGKSTTASLIHAILVRAGLECSLVGNIGLPALDSLKHDRAERLFVFELSSYQLEDLQAELDVGLILNLYPEHLDYHQGVDNYYQAKLNLARCVNSSGCFIFNAHFPLLAETAANLACKKIAFNDQGSFVSAKELIVDRIPLVSLTELKLWGEHNQLNALAAAKVALLFDVPRTSIKDALITFKPLPHRLEDLGFFESLRFINDALSTTPQSTLAALRAIPQPIGSLILGGFDRGYDFSGLATAIIETQIPCILLFPTSGQRIKQALDQAALQQERKSPQSFFVSDMESCVRLAYQQTPPDSVCLLSTASPSYGLFKNYQQKGELFRHWVKVIASELKQTAPS